ncbi:NAD(P)-dependent alcohol dehydrogenase [Methanobacterium sp.]|uniref:NAD(P)-dependent alcohol dehydrogenase n=1 Tax=Methanobacterium sp. TaxID=2164 RepID=UPI0025FB2D20|nr:NAD(P)-dependent alcohol dehydrogenase [Methanobacterium sp.]MBI5458214.1 NAD(P)-dependent alcohol dehydrogenase [Methanobacterium sp.]
MKAIVYTKYGSPDVLEFKEVEKPTPKDNEVLIRVCATSVTAADCLMRRGDTFISRVFLGFRKPRRRILGTEIAGEIEETGKDVNRFKKGDQVYGFTGFGLGAYAEYNCMPENGSLVLKPTNMNYSEAVAVVDGASTALFFLKDKANIQNGQKVLILGASGSIGTFAIQIAKYFGAEVTGVCSNANLDLVKSLGADKVIDYTKDDFTKNSEKYDIIFDTVGKSSFSQSKRSLKKNGKYILTTGGLMDRFLMLWTALLGGKKQITGMSIEKTESLIFIKRLIEAKRIKLVTDRCYNLEQIAKAHGYVEKGHKRGNVIITME